MSKESNKKKNREWEKESYFVNSWSFMHEPILSLTKYYNLMSEWQEEEDMT